MSMRDHINATQMLFEMPGLLVGSEDFGLDNRATNLSKARILLSANHEVIREDDRSVLVKTGTNDGAIGLISKQNSLLYYFVKYETAKWPLTGSTVTQVELWRSRDADQFIPQVTMVVLFDVLVARSGTVMSDRLQTEDGAFFWRRAMGYAINRRLFVGMADFSLKKIVSFDLTSGKLLSDWIKEQDAWGQGSEFKNYRFLISKHPFPST